MKKIITSIVFFILSFSTLNASTSINSMFYNYVLYQGSCQISAKVFDIRTHTDLANKIQISNDINPSILMGIYLEVNIGEVAPVYFFSGYDFCLGFSQSMSDYISLVDKSVITLKQKILK